MQKWATACRNHRFAELGICRSLCKKVCRENARLYFNSSAFSTASVFYERFNKAHLTVIMFSHKHRTELEGRNLDAFLLSITKILCHLIACFLTKEPFANRTGAHLLSPFPPLKSHSSRAPSHFLEIHFHHSYGNSAAASRTHTDLWPHAANNAISWSIIYLFRSQISTYQRLDKASY